MQIPFVTKDAECRHTKIRFTNKLWCFVWMSPLESSILNWSRTQIQWGNWNDTNTNSPVRLFTELALEMPLRFQYQILFGWQTLELHTYITMTIITCSTWLKNKIFSNATTTEWICNTKINTCAQIDLLHDINFRQQIKIMVVAN